LRDRRHVTIHDGHVAYDASIEVSATLDLADAQDLGAAVAQGAATLKALGSTDTIGGRRAAALGDLARRQIALDLHTQAGGSAPESGGDPDAVLPKARQVVLHVHAHAAFTRGFETAPGGLLNHPVFGGVGTGGVATGGIGLAWDPLARLEEGQRLVLLDQVKAWCTDTHTTVTIRPVIDTGEVIRACGHTIPDRLREQVILRDQTCVFPHCTRPARRCQLDHVIAYDQHAEAERRPQPGPTSSDNLACLCTFHHRLKTHGRWTYQMVALGVFEWTSPHGHRFRRDHHGTTPLDQDPDHDVDPDLDHDPDPDDVHRRP
jgi:hypothetical protein